MLTMPETSFHGVYRALLEGILDRGTDEPNRRTGTMVRSLMGGTSFAVDLSAHGQVPVCGVRRLFPRTAAAEVAWFLSGRREIDWLRMYAPIWDKFVEADGQTVESAYGYRWRQHFGRDQIDLAVRALRRDPSDRRVVVSAWDPDNDGLGALGQRNVPCPTHFTLSIVGGMLHSSLFIRSSDVFVGLPYDVMGHALLMDAFVAELDSVTNGAVPGTMHVTLAHPHLYECHWEMAERCLEETPVVEGPPLPGWSLSRIVDQPDEYVGVVGDSARGVEWPAYNPRPELVL